MLTERLKLIQILIVGLFRANLLLLLPEETSALHLAVASIIKNRVGEPNFLTTQFAWIVPDDSEQIRTIKHGIVRYFKLII